MDAAWFIASIASAPSDELRWIHYADWLLQRDDPRGELIHLELAIEQGRGTDEMRRRVRELASAESRLLSPRLAAQSHFWRFRFWRGFIRGAHQAGAGDDPPGREAVDALFADPHACFLDDLGVMFVGPCRALVECERPTIRRLRFSIPELSGALTKLPALERLRFDAFSKPESRVEQLSSPRLRFVEGPLSASLLQRLATELPVLEELLLPNFDQHVVGVAHPTLRSLRMRIAEPWRPGAFDLPALRMLSVTLLEPSITPLIEDMHSLFVRPPPALDTLYLRVERSEGVLESLATTALAQQLRSLTLEVMFDLDDEALLATLVARAQRFPRLEMVLLADVPFVDEYFAERFPPRTIPELPGVTIRTEQVDPVDPNAYHGPVDAIGTFSRRRP